LLISLSLSSDKDRPQDLTGEVTVGYHHSLNNCRQQAVKDNQRIEKLLKAEGFDKLVEDLKKETSLEFMAICWNGKDGELVYPKTIGSPWLAVIARFMLISYVEPTTGKHDKVGTGIARVGRFSSLPECHTAVSHASAKLAHRLKPKEETAVFCLKSNN